MKKILLLLLIIPLVSFGQKVKYQLLDSSLNVVKVKNIHKLSSKERKNIYHYAEYSYNSDEALIGINNYYAKGKYPTYNKITWLEITNKKDVILVEIKTTKAKNATELPYGAFFGITQNEEDLFKAKKTLDFALCIQLTKNMC